MSEDDIFELIKDIEGSGEATHEALDELATKIEDRLKSRYCRDAHVDWGIIEGEEEPTYAKFILQLKASPFKAGTRGKAYKGFSLLFGWWFWLPLSPCGMRGVQPLGKYTIWGDL